MAVAGPDETAEARRGTRESAHVWAEIFSAAQPVGGLYFVDHSVSLPNGHEWVHEAPSVRPVEDWHPEDSLFAPLTAPSGDWVGVLSVDLPSSGRRALVTDREIIELFADHAAIAILHAQMHALVQKNTNDLWHAAHYDALTGLANRALLRSSVEDLMRQPGREIGVLVIDLDGFKLINDTVGHEAGDEVLTVLATRMQQQLRAPDLLARTGGDEFVLLVQQTDVASVLPRLAERLKRVLSEPVDGVTGRHDVGGSIGMAMATTPFDFSRVLAEADAAMYEQKRETHRQRTITRGGGITT